MLKRLHTFKQQLTNTALAILFVATQIAFPLAASGVFIGTAHAAPVCINDTAGANDEPGQKDLTKLCVDYAGVPTTVQTTWQWDETGTNGANTMDACSLFDTDGDGNINYSVCVTTTGDPAVKQSLTTYSCGDDKVDRCTSPVVPVSSGTTSCDVSQVNTDPFPTGSSSPKDTQGTCTVQLSTVGGATAKLIDVCSYPSEQPNSDPSDCVIAQPKAGKLEVVKDLVPASDSGLFNLQVDGTTKAANVGDNGTTGEVVVPEGNHSVGETAGTNTSLAGYTSSISCRNLNGTGSVIASGSGTSLANVPVADGSDIVCTITNTASGSITIIKDAQPNSAQDFAYTATGSGVSNFSLDDDSDPTLSNTKAFTGLAAGSYSFTEAAVNGWDQFSIDCGQAAGVSVNGATVTINLAAGQNVTCTYVNKQRGTVTVHKVTDPANDPTQFSITASGTGNIAGNATRTLTTSQDVVYDVSQGTYGVSEQVPAGWTQSGNTCTSLVIDANNLSRTCTITNTKLSRLTITKDAQPNDAQDFSFLTTGTGLSNFSLDDDSDQTLSNTKQFIDLAAGSYSVTEQSVSGWQLTGLTCSGTNSYTTNGSMAQVTLVPGDVVSCAFTNTKLGSISGSKFNDLNGNGVWDQGEPALSGWTITLTFGQSSTQQVTDQNGNYMFIDLLPGSYSLAEVLQAGWTQTAAPGAVNLSAGQNSTGNDFGNFQHGSISGYKFNDHNGNGVEDQGDEHLSGWTITLKHQGSQDVSTVTDQNGNYSFTDLVAGTYTLCETLQTGWVQTYPANNACHTVVIDQSGETNPNTKFGNQGRGSIQVIKNVDTDGDGDVDLSNVNTWTYNIDGSGGFATGSTQSVAAGQHSVAEVQQADYHVTASSCTGETTPGNPTTTLNVTVSPAENVVCTFTNTRNTGTITVIKQLDPESDAGLFDLLIDTTTYKTAASDGDSTGAVQLPTGNYTVSELASATSPTTLGDYLTSYSCTSGRTEIASGNATTSSSLALTTDANIVCTFTNTRKASLTIVKDAVPNDAQDFNFTLSRVNDIQELQAPASTLIKSFSLDDDDDGTLSNTELTTGLTPGTYIIHEDATSGWDLTGVDCGEQNQDGDTVLVLAPGDAPTCTFTNIKRATIVVTKYNDLDRSGTYDPVTDTLGVAEETLAGWEINLDKTTQTTGVEGTTTFSDVVPSQSYGLSENQQEGWTQINITCTGVEGSLDGDTFFFTPAPGATINCFVGNAQAATLNVTKSNNRPDPTTVGDTVTYTIVVTVPENSGAVFNSTVTDLPPDNFIYEGGSWTAVVTHSDNSAEDLKGEGVTTEPTYGSPGVWQLGALLPGDVVTLTYRALITNIVTPGTYPDIAFAEGTAAPADDSEVVLATCASACIAGEDGAFVGTTVALVTPVTPPPTFTGEVLGTSILVNTGTPLSSSQFIIPSLLIVATLFVNRATSKRSAKKGANR